MPNPQDEHKAPVNPRDPQGGSGATLNPTRDHVQGEPEDTPPASTPKPPPSPPPAPPPHDDKHHEDKSSHKR